jgi:hypothetical protein
LRILRQTALAAMVVMLGVSGSAPSGVMQSNVGVCRHLASRIHVRARGERQGSPYWGPNPTGLIVYTADGHIAAQVYDTPRVHRGVIGLPRSRRSDVDGTRLWWVQCELRQARRRR